MFGLDARISMVIFAILSLSIGTFTYHRIQTAKHTTLIKELNEISKAITELQHDSNTFYAFAMNRSANRDDFAALWNVDKVAHRFQSTWNGPYLNKETSSQPFYGEYFLKYAPDDMEQQCTYKNNCYVWIGLTEVPTEVWEAVNEYVDENLSDKPEADGRKHLLGRIRAEDTSEPRTLYYRSISRLKK